MSKNKERTEGKKRYDAVPTFSLENIDDFIAFFCNSDSQGQRSRRQIHIWNIRLVSRVAYHGITNEHEINDILNDSFLSCYQILRNGEINLTYILKVIDGKIADYYRDRSTYDTSVEDIDTGKTLLSLVDWTATSDPAETMIIYAILMQLHVPYQSMLILRYFFGLSVQEITYYVNIAMKFSPEDIKQFAGNEMKTFELKTSGLNFPGFDKLIEFLVESFKTAESETKRKKKQVERPGSVMTEMPITYKAVESKGVRARKEFENLYFGPENIEERKTVSDKSDDFASSLYTMIVNYCSSIGNISVSIQP